MGRSESRWRLSHRIRMVPCIAMALLSSTRTHNMGHDAAIVRRGTFVVDKGLSRVGQLQLTDAIFLKDAIRRTLMQDIKRHTEAHTHTTDTQSNEKTTYQGILSHQWLDTHTHTCTKTCPAVHLFFPLSHPSPPTFMEKEFKNAWVFSRGGLSSAQSLRSVR